LHMFAGHAGQLISFQKNLRNLVNLQITLRQLS
jgi:hypothetical protein